MELHELESAWKSLDQRIARQDDTLARLQFETRGLRSRWRLHLATAGQVAQIAIGLLLAIWGGGFWFDHLGTAHLVAYGLGVHVYGIALLVSAIVLIVRLAGIDHAQPVGDVQRHLLELRRTRIATERVLWLLGAIAWVPLLMMLLHALRIDVWLHSPEWVLLNLAVGVALAIAAGLAMSLRPAWFAKVSMDGALRDVEAQLAELEALRSA